MHTDNAYLLCFQSNFFLCITICCLCRNSYLSKLCLFNDNFSICFLFNFQLKTFSYKQINALFSIALLRCIIMNSLVLALLFNLVFYIFLHRCFVDIICFHSNVE